MPCGPDRRGAEGAGQRVPSGGDWSLYLAEGSRQGPSAPWGFRGTPDAGWRLGTGAAGQSSWRTSVPPLRLRNSSRTPLGRFSGFGCGPDVGTAPKSVPVNTHCQGKGADDAGVPARAPSPGSLPLDPSQAHREDARAAGRGTWLLQGQPQKGRKTRLRPTHRSPAALARCSGESHGATTPSPCQDRGCPVGIAGEWGNLRAPEAS